MDHLLKRHDVPSRKDDVLPDSSVHADQNPGPFTAEKEQENMATKEVSTNTGESKTESQARRSWRTRRAPEYLKDYVTV